MACAPTAGRIQWGCCNLSLVRTYASAQVVALYHGWWDRDGGPTLYRTCTMVETADYPPFGTLTLRSRVEANADGNIDRYEVSHDTTIGETYVESVRKIERNLGGGVAEWISATSVRSVRPVLVDHRSIPGDFEESTITRVYTLSEPWTEATVSRLIPIMDGWDVAKFVPDQQRFGQVNVWTGELVNVADIINRAVTIASPKSEFNQRKGNAQTRLNAVVNNHPDSVPSAPSLVTNLERTVWWGIGGEPVCDVARITSNGEIVRCLPNQPSIAYLLKAVELPTVSGRGQVYFRDTFGERPDCCGPAAP